MLISRVFKTLNHHRTFSSLQAAISKGAKIDVHPEVQHALAHNQPMVALETALVTNGLPQPTNLQVGQSLERIVRSTGAIPATIGFVGGRVKIGLQAHELERLADREGNPGITKVSRRDIAPVIVKGLDGGTTCSSTLIFAAMAGIKVFATGGLGGVHRNGENTLDISADLQELARCPVGLVSSGVKSILDIGKTLEYLETLGVPVMPYQSFGNEFPAFFTPKSGFKTPFGVDSPLEAAQIIHTHHILGFSHGQLIAVPIPSGPSSTSPSDISPQGGLLHQTTSTLAADPKSASALTLGETVQRMVDQAIKESEENGISQRGKEVTPWLLARVAELSGGKSIELNIKLLERTALVGAQIAVEYAKLSHGESAQSDVNTTTRPSSSLSTAFLSYPTKTPAQETPLSSSKAKVIIAGCSAVDVLSKISSSVAADQAVLSTAPGSVSLTLGGVGRNIAEACHRILRGRNIMDGDGMSGPEPVTLLVSPVGNDAFGRLIVEETKDIGMRVDGLSFPVSPSTVGGSRVEGRTAVCNMMLNANGELITGVADMDIVKNMDADIVIRKISEHNPEIVCLDGNLSEVTVSNIVRHCRKSSPNAQLFFEPTSILKSTTILPSLMSVPLDKPPITYISPNLLELSHIYRTSRELGLMETDFWWQALELLSIGESWRRDLGVLSKMDVSRSEQVSKSGQNLGFLVKEGIAQMAVHLLPFFQHIFIKCGSAGVVLVFRSRSDAFNHERTNAYKRIVVAHARNGEAIVLWHFPALPILDADIINVTGAGDSFVGALLAGLVEDAQTLNDTERAEKLVNRAQQAAIMSLGSDFSVSPLLGCDGKDLL